MAPKKSLKQRKAEQLRTRADAATKFVRTLKVTQFNRALLCDQFDWTDREAAQVASQLKKDLVLYGENEMTEDEMSGTLYRIRPVNDAKTG